MLFEDILRARDEVAVGMRRDLRGNERFHAHCSHELFPCHLDSSWLEWFRINNPASSSAAKVDRFVHHPQPATFPSISKQSSATLSRAINRKAKSLALSFCVNKIGVLSVAQHVNRCKLLAETNFNSRWCVAREAASRLPAM